ncbi:(4Fe-4S)-binding protein [Pararhodonellum marinum]|uniref:(4Fe-4S)-binding protein n=1 Tax=Pararhodonellum marinum TaxID=2755358 RepID=UPI00188EDF07|nr:(4Fe-4S)-binding protein [Pararhodonellum marinum]
MEKHEYQNGEVTILWKPKLRIHAGVCVRTLPKVYDPKARPWIKAGNATAQELIDQVAKCPSGALSIKKEPDYE